MGIVNSILGIVKHIRETGIHPFKWTGKEKEIAGYRGYDGYPIEFQAANFPIMSEYEAKEIRLTGNNQAFFFVQGVKNDEGKVVDVKRHTKALETLFYNIISQGETAKERPLVRLQIDADVFENPKRFVEKYQALRSEKTVTRKRLLGTEAEIIRTFVQNDGFRTLARKVLKDVADSKGENLSEEILQRRVESFMKHNFRLEGVRTPTPLQFATWHLRANGKDVLLARQEYKNSTYMVDRPWQLGTGTELKYLAQPKRAHSGAIQILNAVNITKALPTIDLTTGESKPLPAVRRTAPGLKPKLDR